MLVINNLHKVYKNKKGQEIIGVNDVSLTVEDGEIFGIVGYSGAGKSSLLRCINLLEQPTSGDIYIDDVNITKLKGKKLRDARLNIGMIFQHFYLISQKTVGDNIAFALRSSDIAKERIDERVNELLAMVGLSDKKDVYPNQLSGGQKQRVGIARALANNPSILLCDEATSALDPKTTQSILKLLKEINKSLGITIILITHEMDVVKEICDKMIIMQDGSVIEGGSVYDMFANPQKKLTQEFINSVVSFDLPPSILANVTGRVVKILFEGDIASEGIISDMIQQFAVKGNFLHGTIEYIQERPLGIFIMELQGDEAAINEAQNYMKARGVTVEVLDYAI